MDDFRGLFVASWSAPGRTCSWKAFILAEDHVEAEYFWHMHLKKNTEDAETWHEGKRNCCCHAYVKPGEPRDADEFSRLYPRKRRKGVYECEPIRHSCETDHVRD